MISWYTFKLSFFYAHAIQGRKKNGSLDIYKCICVCYLLFSLKPDFRFHNNSSNRIEQHHEKTNVCFPVLIRANGIHHTIQTILRPINAEGNNMRGWEPYLSVFTLLIKVSLKSVKSNSILPTRGASNLLKKPGRNAI